MTAARLQKKSGWMRSCLLCTFKASRCESNFHFHVKRPRRFFSKAFSSNFSSPSSSAAGRVGETSFSSRYVSWDVWAAFTR